MVSKQLKAAIEKAAKAAGSLHAVTQAAGVAYPSVYRFVNGERSLKLETVDLLCRHLKLELRPANKKSTKKGERC